ncbi:MAG TPA: outer membrane beta-barrel protein [Terracidiphilus sp.]|nr:outer membrane beta-barrel protein [Terracidiphilus sp.]
MRTKRIEITVVLMAATVLGCSIARAQTDIAGSFYEMLNGGTKTGNGTVQSSPNSQGGMMELRHIQKNPLIGYELTYGFNEANQTYAPETGNCGFQCGNAPETVKGNASQVGIDWVPTFKAGKLQAFGVAGLGFYINTPSVDIGYLNTTVRPMWVYGAGIDWGLTRRAGIRLQYRGEMFKDPNLDDRYNTTGQFVHASLPMVGFYFTL